METMWCGYCEKELPIEKWGNKDDDRCLLCEQTAADFDYEVIREGGH